MQEWLRIFTPGHYPTEWDPNPARRNTYWWMLPVSIFDKPNNVGEGITMDERTHQTYDRLLGWFLLPLSRLILDKVKGRGFPIDFENHFLKIKFFDNKKLLLHTHSQINNEIIL